MTKRQGLSTRRRNRRRILAMAGADAVVGHPAGALRPAALLALALVPGCMALPDEGDGPVMEPALTAGPAGTFPPGAASPVPVAAGADAGSVARALPPELQELGPIRLASRQRLGLAEILARLSAVSDLPILLLGGSEGRVLAAVGPGSVPGLLQAERPTGELAAAGLEARMRPDFRHNLPDILDRLADRYGLAWEFDGNSVVFRQFVTRQYRVAAMPVRTEFAGQVGQVGSAGSVDLAAEIDHAMRSIAGTDATISYGKASGHVIVTARPHKQREIASYLDGLNAFLGRQVAFDVNVLTITRSRTLGRGLEVELFAGSEEGDSLRWTGRHGPVGATGTVNVGVLSGDVDLELFVARLDRLGHVSVETRTGVTAANNRMVPIQVVSETAYARKVEAVPGQQGETRTSIEPGTLTTGFEMNLLPRIQSNGSILLSYSIRLSDLNDLAEFTSDRQTIQLPRVSTTSFEQQAVVADKQTLVLMGFERDRRSRDRSDSGMLPFFGSRAASTSERISTVLMIRPTILGHAAGEAGR